MSFSQDTDNAPVTVDVIRQVKPGFQKEFERVLTELIVAAEQFEGHLGVNVFRPSDPANLEYRIVFKFDHLSNLRRWEESPTRQRLLEEANRLTIDAGQYRILTGLETWFTLSTQRAIVPPPRYKMLLVTCLAAFPTANLINFLMQPLSFLPQLLQTLIGMVTLLTLMTYVVMPRMTRLFTGWLYPKSMNR
jgi:hypothetical protein